MLRLAVIALVCLIPLTFGKKSGFSQNGVDAVIKTILRRLKPVTVTLNSDDLITLVTARTGRLGFSRRKVYFSACLTGHVKNMQAGQRLLFKDVMINRGGGYNPNNGAFVCPVSGYYWFSLDYLSTTKRAVYLMMLHNGKAAAYTYAMGQPKAVSRSVIVELKKGDVVTVVNHMSGGDYHGGKYTGFSGFLL